MAEWTNLFDLGECTVSVLHDTGGSFESDFSGVLAKGESDSFELYGATIGIEVTESGAVVLTGDSLNAGYDVRVSLVSPVDHAGEQLSGVLIIESATSALASVNKGAGGYTEFDPSNPPAPIVLTDLAGDHEYLAVFAESVA